MIDHDVEAALGTRHARKHGDEISFDCPAHDAKTGAPADWNRRKGAWHCMSCGAGGSTRDLAQRLGIHVETPRESAEKATIVATYDYLDEHGALLYQKVRFQPKDFKLRRPDGHGGWQWGVGSRWVLYRLPELLASAGRVYVCEGEKDADALTLNGLTATTCGEGAQGRSKQFPNRPATQKWKANYNDYLIDRDVVFLPDNDVAGSDFATAVAAQVAPRARSVRVLALPGLPDKGDVTDWLLEGGTREQLDALADTCPIWEAPAEPQGIVAFSLTDAGNAELFAHLWGDRVRYDWRQQRWLVWDRHRWLPDATGELTRLSIASARVRAKAAADLDGEFAKQTFAWAKRSESAGSIDAGLKIARALSPLADAGEGWDANPLLIGCENGVINLATGEHRDGRREDRVTKSTGVVFDAAAECPRWMQFLNEVFAGDMEIITFIQRAAGYSLTGSLREQVWFLLNGSGANGKSTFVDVLARLAGDYGADTPAETITGKGMIGSGAATPDIAALQGKRLVTCSETEDAAKVSSARVKQLTGGSPVSARALYQGPITFLPQLHLWITTNHLPRVDDESEGYWRRVRLVLFGQKFEGLNRDPALEEKLLAELPGILTWAVAGAVEWHRGGLRAPDSVMMATNTYRQSSDPLGEFISDCCVVSDKVRSTRGQLYEAYKAWAKAQGWSERDALGAQAFGRRVAERFTMVRSGTGRWYHGIGLRADSNSDATGVTEPRFEKFLGSLVPSRESFQNSVTSVTSVTGCDCEEKHPGETACDGEWFWADDDNNPHCPVCHPEEAP